MAEVIHCTCSDNAQKPNTVFPGQDDTCMNESAAAGCHFHPVHTHYKHMLLMQTGRPADCESLNGKAAQILCTNTLIVRRLVSEKLQWRSWFAGQNYTRKIKPLKHAKELIKFDSQRLTAEAFTH